MQRLRLAVILESDEDGYFVSCPARQGCYSQGETYEEALANIKDAMRLHLEDVSPDGRKFLALKPVPSPPATQINVVLNWTEDLRRASSTNIKP